MFGYVRPFRSQLGEEDWNRYQSVYCGLCHRLRRQCGVPARFTLNYDFVFLFLLLDDGEGEETSRRRCAAHPLEGRSCLAGGPAMDLCAWECVILTYYKLQDGIADEGFRERLRARLAARLLKRSYRRALAAQGTFDRHVAACLGELDALERQNSPQLDRVADTFARLLAGCVQPSGAAELDRPRAQLLYHLGRWIYLVDAADDLAEDTARGRYNPLAARFGGAVDQEYLATTMTHSLTLAQSAFQLLPRNRWASLLENILYLGLPNVQSLVLTGKWRERDKESERSH